MKYLLLITVIVYAAVDLGSTGCPSCFKSKKMTKDEEPQTKVQIPVSFHSSSLTQVPKVSMDGFQRSIRNFWFTDSNILRQQVT